MVQMSIKLPLGIAIVPEGNRSFIKECAGLTEVWEYEFFYKLLTHHRQTLMRMLTIRSTSWNRYYL